MAVNWNMLAAYPNAGEAFNKSFQEGQQQQRQNIVRQAMAALATDPNNQRALAALAQADPATAMQFQQQRLEMWKQQNAQHQDNILKGAEILRQFNPQDQQSYSAALAAAQGAGIDLTGVPQEFNPQYVQGVIHLADALKPQTDSNVQYIPLQPNAPLAKVDKRTGAVSIAVAPNDGSHPVGAPTNAQPLTDADIIRMKGGQAGSPSPGNFSR